MTSCDMAAIVAPAAAALYARWLLAGRLHSGMGLIAEPQGHAHACLAHALTTGLHDEQGRQTSIPGHCTVNEQSTASRAEFEADPL